MKFLNAVLAAAVGLAGIAAFAGPAAEAPALPAGIVAQLMVTGGFLPPGVAQSTRYQIDLNGTVSLDTFYRGDFQPSRANHQLIGRLGNAQLAWLERTIGTLRPAPLVAQNPDGPAGADFPDQAYWVSNGPQAFEIAHRGGDGKDFVLPQPAAARVRDFLEKAFFRASARR